MNDQGIRTAFRQLAAQSTAHYVAVLAPSNLRLTMFRLQRRIEVMNSVTTAELAEIIGLHRSKTGHNLRFLEKQSLIAIGTRDAGKVRRVSSIQTEREKLQQSMRFTGEAQRRYLLILAAYTLAVLDLFIEQTTISKYTTGDDE